MTRARRPLLRLAAIFSAGTLGAVLLAGLPARAATPTIDTHAVVLDSSGKLASWAGAPDQAYGAVSTLAWNYLLTGVPTAENGKPAYYSHSYLNSTTGDPVTWPHNPAGLYAMLTESAARYYQYSGDSRVLTLAQDVARAQLANGMTASSDSWASVPYASGASGSLVYRGADTAVPGSGDGVGVIEPDKVGEFGAALVTLYKLTGDKTYLDAAVQCANQLASHLRMGLSTATSPWPFRVVAKTNVVREGYSSNVTGSLDLFDGLIGLGVGDTGRYTSARASVLAWTLAYPLKNGYWQGYFEDVEYHQTPGENLNQYNAMMFARYLLEHPSADPAWESHVRALIAWVERTFGETQYGVTTIREQQAFFYAMGSHTSRYASVNALLYEKTGDTAALEKAYRAFNWATYMARSDGVVIDGPEVNNQWFTDGYADYVRHFMVGIGAAPQWSPAGQTHLVETTSVVTNVSYGSGLAYTTFDPAGVEKIRAAAAPTSVTGAASWTYDPGTQVLQVTRTDSRSVAVGFGTATPPPIDRPPSTGTPAPVRFATTASWPQADVGLVGVRGSHTTSGTRVTLSAGGTDIDGTADGFGYRYVRLPGSGSVTARVVSQSDSDPWALAGVMIRQSLAPASPHVLLARTPEHGLAFTTRTRLDAGSVYRDAGAASDPVWLRLVRTGSYVTASSSDDGVHWTVVGRAVVGFGTQPVAGLAVSSHVVGRLGTATFDQIVVQTASGRR